MSGIVKTGIGRHGCSWDWDLPGRLALRGFVGFRRGEERTGKDRSVLD